MKRAQIFHPRVFSDQEWVEGYYKRNAWNISQTGKRLAKILMSGGFKSGKILDSGCGFATVPIEIARVFPDARILITDLQRGLLATISKKLRTALTLEEAIEIISKSSLRQGRSFKGPFWWDYRIVD